MRTDEQLEVYETVSRALGKQPRGESLADAAARIMRSPHGNPAWRVAAIVLGIGRRGLFNGPAWRELGRAAKVARRLERKEGVVS